VRRTPIFKVLRLFFCLQLILALPALAQKQEEEIFFEANKAFQEGQYQKAIDGYHQLLDQGYDNGHLHFNLGNAYLRSDQLGRAILHYERARLFRPRDADLKFNLNYALDQTTDALPQPKGFIHSGFFWIDSLTINELFLGFAVINLFFWGILFIRIFTGPEWTYYLTILLLIFWLISGFSFGIKWYSQRTDDRAVIITKEVNILAGPDIKDTLLFKLHEGAIVQQERTEKDWALIQLSNDKRGWAQKKFVEKIQSD
jgi:tetratricopeptide (TPR) repeat protein